MTESCPWCGAAIEMRRDAGGCRTFLCHEGQELVVEDAERRSDRVNPIKVWLQKLHGKFSVDVFN